MPRLRTTKSIKKSLDKKFSVFIRKRDADFSGFARCITCSKTEHWQDMDAGHFQSRNHMATRWNEHNVNAQCKRCNRFLGGMQYRHGKMIDRKFGEGVADKLERLAREEKKFTVEELLELEKQYG